MFGASLTLHAQKSSFPPLKENTIKVNLLSPIFNTVNVSYQRLLSPERSLQLTFSYMNFNNFQDLFTGNTTTNIKGMNLVTDYKVNFSGYGLNGFYAGPFARYMNYERTYEAGNNFEQANIQSIGFGFLLGKQFLFRNTITLDLFAGPAYQVSVQEKFTTNYPSGFGSVRHTTYMGELISGRYVKGYSMRGGITLGFAF